MSDQHLYVGIDIGKASCVAGFLSASLLTRYKRFEACPTLCFEQSRAGFEKLLARCRDLAPLECCTILLERTGHYHRSLVEFLLERRIAVYWMHVQQHFNPMLKSDRYDALLLANILYSQLALGVQVADKSQQIRQVQPELAVATELRGLVRRRYELMVGCVREQNRLTAIKDEIFPELSQMFADCNAAIALSVREHFPTPGQLVAASLEELRTCKVGRRPSDQKLLALQALARESIGVKSAATNTTAVLEQKQMIAELRLLRAHLAEVEAQIESIVAASRQGHILISIPGISAMHAASLLAHIGTIANFRSAAALKSYCGWAPRQAQTGTSYDSTEQARGGNRQLKRTIYLITMLAIQQKMHTEWGERYQELLPKKAIWNAHKGDWEGKMKAFGHIAGSIVTTIYALLRHDHEVLARLHDGEEPPAPLLYDARVHHSHRQGAYQPLRRGHDESLLVSSSVYREPHR